MTFSPRHFILLLGMGLAASSGWGREEGIVASAMPSCESLEDDCGFAATLLQLNDLARERIQVFVAEPPYSVLVNGSPTEVALGGRARRFDLGGGRPFVNAATGVSDIATLNAWNVGHDGRPASILAGPQITNAGVPGRVYKDKGRTVLTYVAGDQPVAGKCRSQLSSYPVPSRRRFLFDLSFQVGEDAAGRGWHMTPPRESPAVLWQMKAPGQIPSMAIGVDTDPGAPDRLRLFFSRKGGHQVNPVKLSESVSILPNQPVRLLMDVFLDERDIPSGGRGYWRAWVNGRLVVDTFGPTLSAAAKEPHQWYLALYLYENSNPLPYSRTVLWGQARMLGAD